MIAQCSWRSLLLACAFLRAPPSHASATDVNALEQYLGNLPAVSDLVAAKDAPVIAWVRTLRGRRSIWVASSPGRAARERVVYADDDGLPISQMSLSADGRYVIYVRGGWPNRQGEINNSLDAPDPQERALWMAETDGNASPRRLAGGTGRPVHAPSFSPDGRTVAYARGGEVWRVSLPDGEPSRLLTIRGSAGALAWSPDGRALAFVSERGTHSFVGVFDLETRRVRFLEPNLDRDHSPVWSPDGRWLAFIRTREEVQAYRFTPRRECIPWSIVVVEMPSGAAHTSWSAGRGAGSCFSGLPRSSSSGLGPQAQASSLMWAAGHQLVFPWEKSGWRQLYRVSVADGAVAQLTSGAGEVTAAIVSRDGRAIVFQANRRVPERFDLWRVAASGGEAEPLWNGGTPYDEPGVALSGQRIAFIGESTHMPRQIMVQEGNGPPHPLVTEAIPGAFPAARMTVPVAIELEADDGIVTRGLLYRPVGPRRDKRPALVWAHGGPADIALPGVSKYDARWLQSAALSGYVVLAVNYRASIGFGLAFREAAHQGGGGASDVRDVIAAGRYLATLPGVDARRIGIFGQSYGGYLTTAALARSPELWAVGASIVGVGDWQMEMELDGGGEPLPFRLRERLAYEELAFESSASAHLESWRAPILFVSGDDDQAGWLQAAIQLGQSLRRRGVEVDALVEPGGTHGPWTHRQLLERVQRTFAFFDRHLKPTR